MENFENLGVLNMHSVSNIAITRFEAASGKGKGIGIINPNEIEAADSMGFVSFGFRVIPGYVSTKTK